MELRSAYKSTYSEECWTILFEKSAGDSRIVESVGTSRGMIAIRSGTDWEGATEMESYGRFVSARVMLGWRSLPLHLSRSRTNSERLLLTRTFPVCA